MGLMTNLVQEQLIKKAVEFLAKNPEKNMESILNMIEALAIEDKHKKMLAKARPSLLDPKSNWHKLVSRVFNDTAPSCHKSLAVNMLAHSMLLGIPKQAENTKKYGFSIPWAVLIDPTARCNLRCKGCWAADYEKDTDLDFDLLDRVIKEGKDLGIYFYVISGGEPLVRKEDLMELATKHSDAVFFVFTNGTLIDKDLAEEAAAKGNIIFALSIEGFQEATDKRRGSGVYDRLMNAMNYLHEAGVFFGFSTTYTRENVDEIGSDAFIDAMIQKGCFFGVFFTYVPVGGEADLEYMATPSQRAYMYERIQEFRKDKSIFLIDFWNDGEAVNGCIAGGRCYIHINAKGDVEPCAFIHYSNCNIKDCSLLDALASPLMKSYQKRQPFNENLLRPCPLIDNPQCLADIVAESGAKSTQLHLPGGTQKLADDLKSYADAWGDIAEKLKKQD